jgi:hypothetical protein
MEQKSIEIPIYKNLSLIDLEGEEWIDCIGYDGIYQVSNMGRVKSLRRYVNGRYGQTNYPINERVLKIQISKKTTTLYVVLYTNGIGKKLMVSNIVYLSFNKSSPKKPNEVIMHVIKDLYNNRLDNLKIETTGESIKEDYKQGNKCKTKFYLFDDMGKLLSHKSMKEISKIINSPYITTYMAFKRKSCIQNKYYVSDEKDFYLK